MLGAIMFVSKLITELIPNVHLLAMFVIVYTVVFRKKALIPIYVYVVLNGVWVGFAAWWIPYLYIWALLWGAVMLLPRDMAPRTAAIVYCAAGGLHGMLFGTLYAPVQALLFGLDIRGMTAWIIAGLPWDAVHAVGNIASCCLCLPMIGVFSRAGLLKK